MTEQVTFQTLRDIVTTLQRSGSSGIGTVPAVWRDDAVNAHSVFRQLADVELQRQGLAVAPVLSGTLRETRENSPHFSRLFQAVRRANRYEEPVEPIVLDTNGPTIEVNY